MPVNLSESKSIEMREPPTRRLFLKVLTRGPLYPILLIQHKSVGPAHYKTAEDHDIVVVFAAWIT